LKRTFLLLTLAVLPLAVRGQVAPEATPVPPKPAPSYKYRAYVGFAYTSLNQVNQSRYGLMGIEGAVTRDFGKYFGISGNGEYYKVAAGTGTGIKANPGDPRVYSALAAPEIHASIFGPLNGILFGELGIEHTGGEHMIPSTSFAGGFGGGMSYNVGSRWAIRVTGDRLAASFSLINNSPALNYSTHRTWNPRATIGLEFRF
jgi:hypothetical protein